MGELARYNPGSAASTKKSIRLRKVNRNSFDFNYSNTIFCYIFYQFLLPSSVASLLNPIPEQSYATIYLPWKVHNISAGTESGISGSYGAATCFPLSFSPWHLLLYPTSGNRSGLPRHYLGHTV